MCLTQFAAYRAQQIFASFTDGEGLSQHLLPFFLDTCKASASLMTLYQFRYIYRMYIDSTRGVLLSHRLSRSAKKLYIDLWLYFNRINGSLKLHIYLRKDQLSRVCALVNFLFIFNSDANSVLQTIATYIRTGPWTTLCTLQVIFRLFQKARQAHHHISEHKVLAVARLRTAAHAQVTQ